MKSLAFFRLLPLIAILLLSPLSSTAEQPDRTPAPTPSATSQVYLDNTFLDAAKALFSAQQTLEESIAKVAYLNELLASLSEDRDIIKADIATLTTDFEAARANKEAAEQYLDSVENSIQMALNALNGFTPTPAPTPNYSKLANGFINMLRSAFKSFGGMKMYKLEALLNMYSEELSSCGFTITKHNSKRFQITIAYLEIMLISDDSDYCTTIGMYTTDQSLDYEVTKLAIWEDDIDFTILDSGETFFYIKGS